MSERSRQRWLLIHNRLEELFAKHGPPPAVHVSEWLDHVVADPSWGPVGSLLQRLDPLEYARLLEVDAEMRGLPLPVTEPPSPPPAAPTPPAATSTRRGSDW